LWYFTDPAGEFSEGTLKEAGYSYIQLAASNMTVDILCVFYKVIKQMDEI
jgi:hypothetical protein